MDNCASTYIWYLTSICFRNHSDLGPGLVLLLNKMEIMALDSPWENGKRCVKGEINEAIEKNVFTRSMDLRIKKENEENFN